MGGMGGPMEFGRSKSKFQEVPETGVTFEDVAVGHQHVWFGLHLTGHVHGLCCRVNTCCLLHVHTAWFGALLDHSALLCLSHVLCDLDFPSMLACSPSASSSARPALISPPCTACLTTHFACCVLHPTGL